jgi:cellulose biosynthesis protein BcsQ
VSTPVVAFFNNKGGVGKTSLVYHLAHMCADMNRRSLVVDLDPQANLTAAFLDDDRPKRASAKSPTGRPTAAERIAQGLARQRLGRQRRSCAASMAGGGAVTRW